MQNKRISKAFNSIAVIEIIIQRIVPKIITLLTVLVFQLFAIPYTLYPIHAAPPTNFQSTLVVSNGLDGPSGFDIAPDGRIFILERTGEVKIVKDGVLLPELFADLPSVAAGDRGLIGIAFDPDFLNNHYVYFYYTGLDLLNRLVRFNASGDVGTEGPFIMYQTTFPSEQLHVGGGIRFGPDGKLYFAVGDNGYHPNAQDLSNPHGKLLRINADGTIPTDNPFVGLANALPEIWAYGFRNPWKFSFNPYSNILYAGDVGEATTEEINKITKGGNYGWPSCEGVCNPNNASFIDPIFTWGHNGGSAAVTLGPVYNGSLFPEEYQGRLFFGDYALGFIKTMTFDSNGGNSGVFDFDTNVGSVVELRVAPDGSLYYLTYIPAALYRITYSTTGNHIPIPNAVASATKGNEPLTVNFSSNGSYDADGDALTFLWDFGDGTTSTTPNPIKTYNQKGKYIAKLTVSDGSNSAPSNPIVIQVGLPPVVTIGAPQNNSSYRAGDTIFYSASAVDGAGFDIHDGDVTTEVIFHHQTHIHPFLGPFTGNEQGCSCCNTCNNKNGTFLVPTTGESAADTWYEIKVTANDTNGLTDTKSVRINPIVSNLTFNTQPANLQILVDAIPTNNLTVPGVSGYIRELSVNPVQNLNGAEYHFDGWSDGGSIKHNITTQDFDQTFTAHFTPSSGFNGEYFNNTELTGSPTLTRNDPTINFEWGSGSPGPGINAEFFSVRWTKNQFFAAGRYKFITRTDDGVRLFIDGNLVINEWHGQGGTPHEAIVDLTSGNHEIKMEFFDGGGGALAKLNWDLTADQPGGETTPPPPPTTSGYSAEYFNNQNLSGQPILTRTDPIIDFDFGNGSPDESVQNDQFSSRWTKTVNFAAGTYQFNTTADDGVRIFIDNELIIDKWFDQGPSTYTVQKALSAGNHTIKVEYYEAFGGSVINFNYSQISSTPPTTSPPPSISGYFGEYFDNQTLTGTPKLTRTDPEIKFVLNDGSPDAAIPVDHFSTRWTKTQNFSPGTYKFTTTADDGVRVYVDNELIIDKWKDQGSTTYTGETALSAGNHTIKVEYYENGGGSVIIFNFEKISDTAPSPTPTSTPPSTIDFQGEYWNLTTDTFPPVFPTGTPTYTRNDPEINFTWNEFSPDISINVDAFAARWSKNHIFEEGNYKFTLTSDDGSRLFIDNELILDHWTDHGSSTKTIEKTLTAGSHPIKIEYYEHGGGAVMKFNFEKVGSSTPPDPEPTPVSTGDFTGEYFDNITLSGTPILTRQDAVINFVLNEGSPDPLVPADNFSVRWIKTQNFPAGDHTFTIKSDDGIRLYIDDQLIIDDWNDHAMKISTATVNLTQGDHTIKVEYYENAGGAVAILEY